MEQTTAVQLAASVVAIVSAYFGYRARAVQVDRRRLKVLGRDNAALRRDVLGLVGYIYSVRTILLREHGISLPDPPDLESQDEHDEREDEPTPRRVG